MTIEYTKAITSLPSYKQIDGNSDVVFAINWTLIGTDGSASASWGMITEVPYVAGDPFIPYQDLTPEEVTVWIDQYTDPMALNNAEANIGMSIAQQQTVTVPPLPWAPPPPPGT